MTMPYERTKAVIETRELLHQFPRSDGSALPSALHDLARQLLRHFLLEVDIDVSANALLGVWAPRAQKTANVTHPARRDSTRFSSWSSAEQQAARIFPLNVHEAPMGNFLPVVASKYTPYEEEMQLNRTPVRTPGEQEELLGQRLRTLRVHKNLDQATVSARAGISVRSLRNLENGNGSSLHTLILVLRVLGRETWLETIAPVPTINPIMMTRKAVPRQRASKPRPKKLD